MQVDDGSRYPREGMTLPQRFFVSDEIFAQETERLFHGGWFCVGRRDRLSCPGEYFLADIAGESLIVTLDANSKLRAVFDVCRHRGRSYLVDLTSTTDVQIARPVARVA